MDTASLVIGIIAAIIGFIPCVNIFVFVPAIVGLILGVIAYRNKCEENLPSGVALAGIILNSIPILVMVGFFVIAMISGDPTPINEMTIR